MSVKRRSVPSSDGVAKPASRATRAAESASSDGSVNDRAHLRRRAPPRGRAARAPRRPGSGGGPAPSAARVRARRGRARDPSAKLTSGMRSDSPVAFSKGSTAIGASAPRAGRCRAAARTSEPGARVPSRRRSRGAGSSATSERERRRRAATRAAAAPRAPPPPERGRPRRRRPGPPGGRRGRRGRSRRGRTTAANAAESAKAAPSPGAMRSAASAGSTRKPNTTSGPAVITPTRDARAEQGVEQEVVAQPGCGRWCARTRGRTR